MENENKENNFILQLTLTFISLQAVQMFLIDFILFVNTQQFLQG